MKKYRFGLLKNVLFEKREDNSVYLFNGIYVEIINEFKKYNL